MNPIQIMKDRLTGGEKWTKGAMDQDDGSMCLLGAARQAILQTGDTRALARWSTHDSLPILAEVITEQFPDRAMSCYGEECDSHHEGFGFVYDSIWLFNDDHRTTWADVEKVLDKAAIRYEEQA